MGMALPSVVICSQGIFSHPVPALLVFLASRTCVRLAGTGCAVTAVIIIWVCDGVECCKRLPEPEIEYPEPVTVLNDCDQFERFYSGFGISIAGSGNLYFDVAIFCVRFAPNSRYIMSCHKND